MVPIVVLFLTYIYGLGDHMAINGASTLVGNSQFMTFYGLMIVIDEVA
jgi:hypothetical protein